MIIKKGCSGRRTAFYVFFYAILLINIFGNWQIICTFVRSILFLQYLKYAKTFNISY